MDFILLKTKDVLSFRWHCMLNKRAEIAFLLLKTGKYSCFLPMVPTSYLYRVRKNQEPCKHSVCMMQTRYEYFAN